MYLISVSGIQVFQHQKKLMKTALRLLKTADPVDIHGYKSNAGVLEVRENIAKSLNRRFDTNYTAANIFMTIGAAKPWNLL